MSSTVKVLRAKLASCCLSCYLIPPSSSPSPDKKPPHNSNSLPLQPSKLPLDSFVSHSHPPSTSPRIYQCPQCQTSLPDMSQQWLHIDNERASWVMPQHLRDFNVKVKCRDCNQEGSATYHVVGLKCPNCGSYNTVRSGNEEIPMDESVGALFDQLLLQRRRQRRRRERRSHRGDGESSSSSDSESEEDDPTNHCDNSDDERREDPGSGSRSRQRNGRQRGNSPRHAGADQTDQPNEDNSSSRNYDGDDSASDDIDSDNDSRSDCDSDSDYYEARRSRTYTSFARRGYTMFLTPIEVPVGYDPGALEWWQDTNNSDPEVEVQPHPQTHHQSTDRGHEECDNGNGISQQHHQRPRHVRIPDELNNPTELRRRAIADSIIRNMRLWNSDSESFSEVSSDEEKSSDSWVTEEEEVIIGGGSEMQEAEQVDKNEHRDVPLVVVTTVTQSQSESGMESAESWFTSSDNSHSQLDRGEVLDQHPTKTRHCEHGLGETSLLNCPTTEAHVGGEAPQCKNERGSVCSSVCTDDSLAWETACEDLPVLS